MFDKITPYVSSAVVVRGLGNTDLFDGNESHFHFAEVSVSMTVSVKPYSVNAHAAFRLYCKIGLDMVLSVRACFHCRYSYDNKPQMQLAARDPNNKKTITFVQKSETAHFTELWEIIFSQNIKPPSGYL